MEMRLPVPGPGLPGGRGEEQAGNLQCGEGKKKNSLATVKTDSSSLNCPHVFPQIFRVFSSTKQNSVQNSNGHWKNWNGDWLSRTQNINKTNADSYKLACLKTLILPYTIRGKAGQTDITKKKVQRGSKVPQQVNALCWQAWHPQLKSHKENQLL